MTVVLASLLAAIGVVVAFVVRAITTAATSEVIDRVPDFASAQLDRAISALPPDDRTYYEPTWRGELHALCEEHDRPITVLVLVAGYRIAAVRIRREASGSTIRSRLRNLVASVAELTWARPTAHVRRVTEALNRREDLPWALMVVLAATSSVLSFVQAARTGIVFAVATLVLTVLGIILLEVVSTGRRRRRASRGG